MKSFLAKRRKSVSAGQGGPAQSSMEEKPPMPMQGAGAAPALPTLDKVRMPDLRFSRLDLDPIGGLGTSLEGLGNSHGSGGISPSQTQLLSPSTGAAVAAPKRSSSHTNLAATGQSASQQSASQMNTLPRSATAAPSKGGINGLFNDPAPAPAAAPAPAPAPAAAPALAHAPAPMPGQGTLPGQGVPTEQKKRRSMKASTPPRSPVPQTPPPDIPPPPAPSNVKGPSPSSSSPSSRSKPTQQEAAGRATKEEGKTPRPLAESRSTSSSLSSREKAPKASLKPDQSRNERGPGLSQSQSHGHMQASPDDRRKSATASSRSKSPQPPMSEHEARLAQLKAESERGVQRAKEDMEYKKKRMEELERYHEQQAKNGKDKSQQQRPPQQQRQPSQPQMQPPPRPQAQPQMHPSQLPPRQPQLQPQPQPQPHSQQRGTQGPPLQPRQPQQPPEQRRGEEEASGKKTSSLKKRLSSFGLTKKKEPTKEELPQMPVRPVDESQQAQQNGRPSPQLQQAPPPRDQMQPQQQPRSAPSAQQQQQQQQRQQQRAPGTLSNKSSQKSLKGEANQRRSQLPPSPRPPPSPQSAQEAAQEQRQGPISDKKSSSNQSKPKQPPQQPPQQRPQQLPQQQQRPQQPTQQKQRPQQPPQQQPTPQQAQQLQQTQPPQQAPKQKPSPPAVKVPGQGKDGGQMAAFQFPRPSQEQPPSQERRSPQPSSQQQQRSAPPGPTRSNSALVARDGVAKPIPPQRGMTQDEGRYAAAVPSSPYNSQNDAITSSSSEATTTDGVGSQSQETNPSSAGWAYRSADDGSEVEVDDDEGVTQDLQQGYGSARTVPESMSQARPRRDEERAERAQSRLSMNLDGEMEANAGQQQQTHQRADSKFGALLAGAKTATHQHNKNSSGKGSSILDMDDERRMRRPSTPPRRQRERERVVPAVKREPNPDLIVYGFGWKTHGLADSSLIQSHDRFETVAVQVPKSVYHVKKERGEDGKEADANKEEEESQSEDEDEEVQIEYEEEMHDVRYNDLFELIWTSTTPDVTQRLISHLDFADIKALRQTCSNIRFTLSSHREMIISRYLACVGYTSWKATTATTVNPKTGKRVTTVSKDPCPLSFTDCEAFLLSHDLLPEYAAVGKEYAMAPTEMDPRLPRLARATTRAYNRVLTRLRLQPTFRVPTPPGGGSSSNTSSRPPQPSPSGSRLSASPSHSPLGSPIAASGLPRANSYYPSPSHSQNGGLSPGALPNASLPTLTSPVLASPRGSPNGSPNLDVGSFGAQQSPQLEGEAASMITLPSPYKPGRAAQFRVWVPALDSSGWLSDEELTLCEGELYRSGIWNLLRRGDVVWDVAIGDSLNEGKFVFDGHYLRDLSYAYDVAGHLPSWLNSLIFPPSYWHNVLRSSTSQPVIYLDVSPFKDQILSSLRLVQDHVDSVSPQGRYRIAKWLYRAVATTTAGQIISQMDQSLQVVDSGWHGKIVIETEGTAEHAKALVSRCAEAGATPQQKAALLASVMGGDAAATASLATADSRGPHYGNMNNSNPKTTSSGGQNNFPFVVLRERSRPGLIWIRPVGERERVTAA